MLDQTTDCGWQGPLMSTTWTILEAANDLGDNTTVEVCRRIIDTALCGLTPSQSDVRTVFGFFD
jgi:hypothetical protein